MTGSAQLLTLLGMLLGPLAVDLALLCLALELAKTGSRALLLLPAVLYVVVNVGGPLVVTAIYFRNDLVWLLVLFAFVKFLEFGPLKVGRSFAELWSKARVSGSDPAGHGGPNP